MTAIALGALGSATHASGDSSRRFTGVGIGAEYDYASGGNFMPTLSLVQGSSGFISYFGGIEVGYRTPENSVMARARVEGYFLFFGLYGGVQSNTSTERPADYGFPMGIGFCLPKHEYFLRLHVGSIVYTKGHANEFQVSAALYYPIW